MKRLYLKAFGLSIHFPFLARFLMCNAAKEQEEKAAMLTFVFIRVVVAMTSVQKNLIFAAYAYIYLSEKFEI
ncbi:hypothetical protein T07_9492 [Trichinella nelsoni]|uniref:Uncharacterized protein n=1 Tax=Trichinella nelsoni TaxID=6336 RepID=A0A0V0RXX7_9BILA|nr:hypothetical protein T07_9492 [Trichinella nelsoni]